MSYPIISTCGKSLRKPSYTSLPTGLYGEAKTLSRYLAYFPIDRGGRRSSVFGLCEKGSDPGYLVHKLHWYFDGWKQLALQEPPKLYHHGAPAK